MYIYIHVCGVRASAARIHHNNNNNIDSHDILSYTYTRRVDIISALCVRTHTHTHTGTHAAVSNVNNEG
jgi:hypothetical protein